MFSILHRVCVCSVFSTWIFSAVANNIWTLVGRSNNYTRIVKKNISEFRGARRSSYKFCFCVLSEIIRYSWLQTYDRKKYPFQVDSVRVCRFFFVVQCVANKEIRWRCACDMGPAVVWTQKNITNRRCFSTNPHWFLPARCAHRIARNTPNPNPQHKARQRYIHTVSTIIILLMCAYMFFVGWHNFS